MSPPATPAGRASGARTTSTSCAAPSRSGSLPTRTRPGSRTRTRCPSRSARSRTTSCRQARARTPPTTWPGGGTLDDFVPMPEVARRRRRSCAGTWCCREDVKWVPELRGLHPLRWDHAPGRDARREQVDVHLPAGGRRHQARAVGLLHHLRGLGRLRDRPAADGRGCRHDQGVHRQPAPHPAARHGGIEAQRRARGASACSSSTRSTRTSTRAVDSYKNQSIRGALAPLAFMACEAALRRRPRRAPEQGHAQGPDDAGRGIDRHPRHRALGADDGEPSRPPVRRRDACASPRTRATGRRSRTVPYLPRRARRRGRGDLAALEWPTRTSPPGSCCPRARRRRTNEQYVRKPIVVEADPLERVRRRVRDRRGDGRARTRSTGRPTTRSPSTPDARDEDRATSVTTCARATTGQVFAMDTATFIQLYEEIEEEGGAMRYTWTDAGDDPSYDVGDKHGIDGYFFPMFDSLTTRENLQDCKNRATPSASTTGTTGAGTACRERSQGARGVQARVRPRAQGHVQLGAARSRRDRRRAGGVAQAAPHRRHVVVDGGDAGRLDVGGLRQARAGLQACAGCRSASAGT